MRALWFWVMEMIIVFSMTTTGALLIFGVLSLANKFLEVL